MGRGQIQLLLLRFFVCKVISVRVTALIFSDFDFYALRRFVANFQGYSLF